MPANLPPPQAGKFPSECKEAEFVTLNFRGGRCNQINGRDVSPLQAMQLANEIGGRNGLGISKAADGKELFESPGMALLASGLKFVYEEVFDKATGDIFKLYSRQVSTALYNGQYAEPPAQSCLMAIRHLASAADGLVELELHSGEAIFLRLQCGGTVKHRGGTGFLELEHDDVFTPGNGSFSDVQW